MFAFLHFRCGTRTPKSHKIECNELDLAQIAGKFHLNCSTARLSICLSSNRSQTHSHLQTCFTLEWTASSERKLLKAFREMQMGQSHAQGQRLGSALGTGHSQGLSPA